MQNNCPEISKKECNHDDYFYRMILHEKEKKISFFINESYFTEKKKKTVFSFIDFQFHVVVEQIQLQFYRMYVAPKLQQYDFAPLKKIYSN